MEKMQSSSPALADLHCDTAFELWKQGQSLADNTLHISLSRAAIFSRYIQVFAIWSDHEKNDDEVYSDFFRIQDRLADQLAENHLSLSRTRHQLEDSLAKTGRGFLLSIEDARALRTPEHLERAAQAGLCIMTPLWQGKTVIGGSFDTDEGLTPWGRELVERACKKGILPDISHASPASADDILSIAEAAGVPPLASHSNARAVFDHPRNLSDRQAKRLADAGGVVGISLAPQHLAPAPCGIVQVLAHLRHYLSLLGSHRVCLGCDFDGITATPDGLNTLSDLPALYQAVSHTFGCETADRVFFENAFSYLRAALPDTAVS